MRTSLAVAGTAVAALVVAASVGAAGSTLRATPGLVQAGQTVTFTGSGCRAGETVILISKLFPGHGYGAAGDITAKAAANQTFRRAFAVRTTTAAGTYTVTARCGGGNLGVVARVQVTAKPTLRAAPRVVHRGGTVRFTGGPCIAGDTVILLSKLFPGHAYGIGDITTKAAANGTFSRTFTVSSTTAAGSYAVTARCGGGNLGVVARVRVS